METILSLKQQTISGVKWLVGASVANKAISFATTIIIARRLGPSVYGLFAFAMVVVASFELFKSLGVDTALIRRKDDFDRAANTAFMMIPSIGILLFIILIISAPLIGKMLDNQSLTPIIRLLGVIFVISCFSKIPNVYLERDMQFKFLSKVDFICTITFSVGAIIFTFLNFKIWALVLAYILKMLVHMVLVWKRTGWRPKYEFDKKIAIEMLHFGKFILISSIIWFLKMNLDNLLVGKYLGATMLGYYAVAFNIANFGADYFGGQIYRVTYPAYSKLEGNLERLQEAFLKIFKYMCLFAIPLGMGVLLLGEEFLSFVYGSKWLGASSVLKILALAGIFNTLPISTGGIFLACNRPKDGLKITAIQVALFLIFIAPIAKKYSLPGVGYVVVIASLVACCYAFYLVKKLLKMDLILLLNNIKPAMIASLIMSISILIMKQLLVAKEIVSIGHYSFIVMALFAVLIYIYSLFIFESTVFKELKEILIQNR